MPGCFLFFVYHPLHRELRRCAIARSTQHRHPWPLCGDRKLSHGHEGLGRRVLAQVAIFGVWNHRDNLICARGVAGFRAHADLDPKRRWPDILPNKGLIDDQHQRPVVRVVFGEVVSLDPWNPQRREEGWADVGKFAGPVDRSDFDVMTPASAAKRNVRGRGGVSTPGMARTASTSCRL